MAKLEVNNPESVFRINIDILNEAFGVGRGMYAKAVYPDKKNSDIPGTKPGDRCLVFVKDSAQSPYRFVGVFKSGKMEFCKHTYCRIASKVKIIGNPVTKIELLDDNR